MNGTEHSHADVPNLGGIDIPTLQSHPDAHAVITYPSVRVGAESAAPLELYWH